MLALLKQNFRDPHQLGGAASLLSASVVAGVFAGWAAFAAALLIGSWIGLVVTVGSGLAFSPGNLAKRRNT